MHQKLIPQDFVHVCNSLNEITKNRFPIFDGKVDRGIW